MLILRMFSFSLPRKRILFSGLKARLQIWLSWLSAGYLFFELCDECVSGVVVEVDRAFVSADHEHAVAQQHQADPVAELHFVQHGLGLYVPDDHGLVVRSREEVVAVQDQHVDRVLVALRHMRRPRAARRAAPSRSAISGS